MSRKIFALLAALGCFAISGTATAGATLTTEPATDIFTVTAGGIVIGTYEQSVLPTSFDVNSDYFETKISNGTGLFTGRSNISYGKYSYGGGLWTNILELDGTQIFTGSVENPVFSSGVYTGLEFIYDGRDSSFSPRDASATLTISALSSVASAAPEPAAWMMMVLGFGLIGYALRSRHGLFFHKT